MDEGEEVYGSPIIACGEASEVLELVEAALDAISVPIDGPIVGDEDLPSWIGGDNGDGPGVGDRLAQGV
jgi:hypothetical protein